MTPHSGRPRRPARQMSADLVRPCKPLGAMPTERVRMQTSPPDDTDLYGYADEAADDRGPGTAMQARPPGVPRSGTAMQISPA